MERSVHLAGCLRWVEPSAVGLADDPERGSDFPAMVAGGVILASTFFNPCDPVADTAARGQFTIKSEETHLAERSLHVGRLPVSVPSLAP